MKVAILGASGAVGLQMLKCLEERKIDCELKLLASKNSVGKEFTFNNQKVLIEEATEDSFKGVDFVLGAVENDLAKKFSKFIVDAGAVFIDNSSAYRMDKEVPLVVPEINRDDIKLHKGIIANPNCSTIITDMAIYGINKVSKIKRMVTTTFQAVSGAGLGGMKELAEEMEILFKDEKSAKENYKINEAKFLPKKFKNQIAYNLIPCIGSFGENHFTSEEMKMQNESRKILHLPELKASCTCVRVPVMRSHSISVNMELEKKLTVEEVKNILQNTEGVKLVDDEKEFKYPMPINTTDLDIVEVGRIREDLALENGIALFCSGDQIRKGAASNAVQILEELIK